MAAIASPPSNVIDVYLPPKVVPDIFEDFRYKVLYGGRGSAKSQTVATVLISEAHTSYQRIGCFRELQNSITDSVHKLLVDIIWELNLQRYFHITDKSIVSRVTGSEFIFKGIRLNTSEIKSMQGLTRVWIEEAHLVSKDSWKILIPTVRKKGSQMYITFNPDQEKDETYQRFVIQAKKDIALANEQGSKPRILLIEMNWRDNPWFGETELEEERKYLLRVDPEAYDNVYDGRPRVISDAVIFKGRFEVAPFNSPDPDEGDEVVFYHGVDWGFSQDPTCMIRCYITGEKNDQHLWIDQEAWGLEVRINQLETLFDKIKTSRKWPVLADNSRPETISHMSGLGFSFEAAEKWSGSIEDGIEHIKGFTKVHIHPRCEHTAFEFMNYKYKVDKNTNMILPVPADLDNHCIDALRYALDGFIKRRNELYTWGNL